MCAILIALATCAFALGLVAAPAGRRCNDGTCGRAGLGGIHFLIHTGMGRFRQRCGRQFRKYARAFNSPHRLDISLPPRASRIAFAWRLVSARRLSASQRATDVERFRILAHATPARLTNLINQIQSIGLASPKIIKKVRLKVATR
jgi:hypothetical protein